MNDRDFKIKGTATGRIGSISKGYEPMAFTPEFEKAITQKVVKVDLSKIEEKVAERLCYKPESQ